MLVCLLIAGVATAQKGTSFKTDANQGVASGMVGGPHDFTSTATDSLGGGYAGKTVGPTNFLCGYCHVPHVSKKGVAVPLWSRNVLDTGSTHAGITFGTYASGTMDATVNSVTASRDNYSSMCLSCHDGSQLFASSAYISKPTDHSASWTTGNNGFDSARVPTYMNMSVSGSYGGLNHIHPVNFVYNSALASSDKGLFDPGTKSYLYMDGVYGAVGRLFPDGSGNMTMQCSSCHNPHIATANMSNTSSAPLLEGTLDAGALCVACHKK